MKKIIIFLLVILSSFSLEIIKGNNLYFEETSYIEKELSGVKHLTTTGIITNDKMTKTNQEVNVFYQGENVMVVNWSMLANGKLSMAHTLNIAKDFELHNPNYEVIAGVNGDFFWAGDTINANVLFNNRVLNPYNSYTGQFQALEFDKFGNKIDILKVTRPTTSLYFSLYDDNDFLKIRNNRVFFNANVIGDGDSTIINNNENYRLDSNTTYYKLTNQTLHQSGSHTFFEGYVLKEVSSFTKNEYILATKNNDLINIVKTGERVVVQKEVQNLTNDHMLMGFDATIIENSLVKDFSQMTIERDADNKGRHPRTGFGYDKDGKMVLITVDGRQTNSLGVDLREFGNIMNYYGIVEGYNLDGGGSTQAIVRENGELKYANSPSEKYRSVANALLFIRDKRETPNFNYEVNNNKVNFKINDNSNVSKIVVKINDREYEFTNLDEMISVELENVEINEITISYYDKNLSEVKIIYRDVIIKEVKPENVDVVISHEYLNNNLKIIVRYDDPFNTLYRARVYLTNPNINKTTLSDGKGVRSTTFDNLANLEEQEIRVEVTYDDLTVKDFYYQIVLSLEDEILENEEEDKKDNKIIPIIVSVVSGLLLVMSGIISFKLIKK